MKPSPPSPHALFPDEEQYTIYNSVNGTNNSSVLPSLANSSASSSAVVPNTSSITNNVPLSQSAQQISSSNNIINSSNISSSSSSGPLSLSSILSSGSLGGPHQQQQQSSGGPGSGGNAVIGANMISGGTAGQALASILTGNAPTSIGGSGSGMMSGLSHSQSAHQIGVSGGGMSQHQALQQQLQQHFANVANSGSSSIGKWNILSLVGGGNELSVCRFNTWDVGEQVVGPGN